MPQKPTSQDGFALSAISLIAGFAIYFTLAAATIMLTSDGRSHATVWPADAVILALLMMAPRKRWPAILATGWVANLLANAITRDWAAGIVLYGAINMAQTALAANLLVRGKDCAPEERDLLSDGKATVRFLPSSAA